MASNIGPKSKETRKNEYMKKFNAYRRGDKGTMNANENKYFASEVEKEKARKRKSLGGEQKETSAGETAQRAGKKIMSTRGSAKMPDPFQRGGRRTGSESLFQSNNVLENWVDKVTKEKPTPSTLEDRKEMRKRKK